MNKQQLTKLSVEEKALLTSGRGCMAHPRRRRLARNNDDGRSSRIAKAERRTKGNKRQQRRNLFPNVVCGSVFVERTKCR